MSQRYVFEEGRVHVHEAWTVGEVKAAVVRWRWWVAILGRM